MTTRLTLARPGAALLTAAGAILAALVPAGAGAAAQTFEIDPAHSSVGFKVRHFFSSVPGNFNRFEGTITYDPDDPSKCSAQAVIDASSVNTRNKKRDAHLNRDDYFHTAKYPKITFKSTKWVAAGKDRYKMTGELTILGVTQPVTVEVQLLGTGPGRGGVTLSGWKGTAKLDRTDFGLKSGRPAIGSDVEIELNIEAVLKK